jgi:hypothetical protein
MVKKPRYHPENVNDYWRWDRPEAGDDCGYAAWVLAVVLRTRPRYPGSFCYRRNHCQPPQFCPYPLRLGSWSASAYHVHHAMESHPGVSSPVGKYQKYGRRCVFDVLFVVQHGGDFYLERVSLFPYCVDLMNQTDGVQTGRHHQQLACAESELEELSPRTASGLMDRFQVPHTYCWSPALIPKPSVWPPYIGNLLSLKLNHGVVR